MGKRLRGAVRRARARRARARASDKTTPQRLAQARRTELYWERRLRAYRKWRKRPFPHLSGDLDANRDVLGKLERLGREQGRNIYVTSGLRTRAEQQRLWDNRHNNPYPVAPPGTSRHETGRAVDALVGGQAIQQVIPAATIRSVGLSPLLGDAVHLEG